MLRLHNRQWRYAVGAARPASDCIRCGRQHQFTDHNYTTWIDTDHSTVDNDSIKTNLKTIHTTIVRDHLWDRPDNKILSRQAPDVDQDEETLPRLTRRRLAQLSTNKPPFLRQYLHKIDIITHPSDECPLCGASPHDTPHLFDSTELPTDLTTDDLWTNPLGDVRSAGCVGGDGPVPDGRIGARGMLTAGWVSTQQQQRQH